jgi:hypothetical protein
MELPAAALVSSTDTVPLKLIYEIGSNVNRRSHGAGESRTTESLYRNEVVVETEEAI